MENLITNRRDAAIYVALSVLLAVITVCLGFYLVPSTSRDLGFGISLANLVVGELFLGVQLARSSLQVSKDRSFILSLGGIYASIAYLVGAAILSLLEVAGIGEKPLVVLHILLLLAAIVFMALGFIAATAANSASSANFAAGGVLDRVKECVSRLSDRASLLKGPAAAHVVVAIRRLQDDLRFTYAQSDAGSSSDDAELEQGLEAIHQALAKFEASADAAAADCIPSLVASSIVVLKRRNEGIAKRR